MFSHNYVVRRKYFTEITNFLLFGFDKLEKSIKTFKQCVESRSGAEPQQGHKKKYCYASLASCAVILTH